MLMLHNYFVTLQPGPRLPSIIGGVFSSLSARTGKLGRLLGCAGWDDVKSMIYSQPPGAAQCHTLTVCVMALQPKQEFIGQRENSALLMGKWGVGGGGGGVERKRRSEIINTEDTEIS